MQTETSNKKLKNTTLTFISTPCMIANRLSLLPGISTIGGSSGMEMGVAMPGGKSQLTFIPVTDDCIADFNKDTT